jgi:TP901 family phage tail tape measure protein|nr:MAG TPA: tail tape measure [Caudoviricetes sp.]
MSLESVFKLSLVMNMIDNLSGPMAGVASKVGANVSKLDSISETLGNVAKSGAVMQETGNQIVSAVLAPVEATFETKRALGELASLGVQELGKIEEAARSFSDQWAGTTKSDFISAAYDIKSGIASLTDEGVAEYTNLAGLTAKATKSTIGEMTSLFATGYGIYKNFYADLSDIEFGEMFSAGISQSVKQFKTTGSEMASAIESLGASATNANVPLEEQLTVLGMLQATMSGSEAGTKYAAFIQAAAKGGEALGLAFLDANNQLKSMPEIIDQLRGKYGETIDAVEKQQLAEAFGTDEAVDLIDLMYGKIGDLQTNIVGMYDALGSGTGVAMEMASAINETEPERYERLQQRIHNITESIGNSLLPTVNDFMGVGEQVLTKVGSWVEKNQELVKVIMLIVLAVGGFLVVGGTLITVISGVGIIITKAISAFKMLKAGFVLVKGALTPLITSVWSFTSALLANPVTWIVIGIVALIAALVLLYNKCEWFRNAVNAVINFFKEKLGAALEVAKNIFGAIGNAISSVMGAAKATVEEKLSNIKSAYESHGGGIKGVAAAAMEGVKSLYTAGYTFLDNLTGGKLTEIKDKFSEKLAPIKGIVSNVMESAKATASEKLGNMKAAYDAHGGGIKGVAAAAIEGVKGYYTAGYTFLNNLTGGKLGEVKDKFTSAMSGIAQGVSQKFNDVRTFFSNGLNNVKNLVTNAISWFRDSGRKVVTTFAEGISSAFSNAVNAVKNGLQKIRNMLPFSDAKEGPLSTLTLSGQRTMTTYAEGLTLAQNAPAEAMEKGLSQTKATLEREQTKKVNLNGGGDQSGSSGETEGSGSGSKKGVNIQKFIMQVDLKKIKDLQTLLALLQEIEDYTNGNGDEDPSGDSDAVPAPA